MDVMMRRRELMGMQGKLKTVSGPLVTVNDAMARNAKSLVVNFAPIQASGTPSPDNVLPISGWTGVTGYRTGKNLFDINGATIFAYEGVRISNNKIVVSSIGTGGTSRAYFAQRYVAGTYTFSAKHNGDINLVRFFSPQQFQGGTYNAYYGGYYIDTVNGQITVTINNGFTIGIIVGGLGGGSGEVYDIQLDNNSIETDFAPYSGTTYPVTFPAVGKNLFDPANKVEGKYVRVQGYISLEDSSASDSYVNVYYVTAGMPYTISYDVVGTPYSESSRSLAISPNGQRGDVASQMVTLSSFTTGHHSYSFSAIASGWVWVAVDKNTENIMLNTGWSEQTYEPYTNTIYGGYVDLVSGVLVGATGIVDLATISWHNDPNRSGVFYGAFPANRKNGSDILACNSYNASNISVSTNYDYYISGKASYSGASPFLRDSRYAGYTGDEYKTAISGLGYEAVYELATPITYQLTPQTIAMLKGTNNVWANANGNVELTYYAQ